MGDEWKALVPFANPDGQGTSGQQELGPHPDEFSDPPRIPRTLEGVLHFAIRYQNGHIKVPPEAYSEEDRKWLNEAISQLHSKVTDEISTCLDVLTARKDKIAACEMALAMTADYAHDTNYANDFIQRGGLSIYPDYLRHVNETLRMESANLLATLAQNNPYGQERVQVFIPDLLDLLRYDSCEGVRVKAMYALSACVRNFEPALQVFLDKGGIATVVCAAEGPSEKLKIKAYFLLSALFVESAEARVHAYEMGLAGKIVELLKQENSAHEVLLGALYQMVRTHPQSLEECKQEGLELKEILEKREIEGREEANLEKVECCLKLKELVFNIAPVI